MKLLRFVSAAITLCGDYLLHKTIYRSKRVSVVEFYGLDEPVELDGTLIVYDSRAMRRVAHGYRFEDRYLMRLSPAKRCMIVWQEIMLHDKQRPLAMVENGNVYTPFGHYSEGVPKLLAGLLSTNMDTACRG